MKHKLESRLPGEISITSDMQMTPPLWQKVTRLAAFHGVAESNMNELLSIAQHSK